MRNPHQRRTFMQSPMPSIVALLLAAALAASSQAKSRPNVILINIDNHEKGELGHYGNRFIETPGPIDHAADIEGLDRNVGRLMETLDKLELSDNTVIVYMSDGAGGGAASAPKNQWPVLSRASGTPLVIRLPKAAAKRMPERSELVANIDLLPTLAGICGISLGAKLRSDIDGQSFALLLGLPGADPWRPRTYVADHQSRGGKDDLAPENRRMMLFRPLAATRVFLPDGGQVGWRAGKVSDRNATPEAVKQARAAYEKWRRHVVKDLPLGAFETTTHKVTLPTTIALREGRYLLSLRSRSGKGLAQLRVTGVGPGATARRRAADEPPMPGQVPSPRSVEFR